MDTNLIDPHYSPNHWLVLLFVNGQPKFVGYVSLDEAEKVLKPGKAVLVEYMVGSSSGNVRYQTLAEAMSAKAKHLASGEFNVDAQPATPPNNLDLELDKVWWSAPRASDFPDYKVE
jgi:hypothetical protein